MRPHVIKFTSIDGLSRYEQWWKPSAPEEHLERLGVAKLQVATINVNDFPVSLRTYKRIYYLFDSYIDPTNGNYVWEYREDL
jgi:hypothetical protein